ncbi:ABC-2 type transporter [Scytonema sp. HK-05]|nr:ABC-2 type transporter [Scytonema sp. HK-05]
MLGGESRLYVLNFALSLALAVVLLASGILYFRKMERTFADVI